MFFALLMTSAALAQSGVAPIEILVVHDGDHAEISVRAVGSPVAVPACRGVGWERFDDATGGYVPLPGPACGPQAPALWLDGQGTTFSYTPTTSGFQVLRPVVVYGVGCRQGLPFSLADCDAVEALAGPNAPVRGPAPRQP